MAQSWETLRKEARRLETEIDANLVDYSKIAAGLQSASATTRTSFESSQNGTEDEAVQRRNTNDKRDASTAEAMTTDMEALLSKLAAVIEAMTSIHQSANGAAKPPGATAAAHTLQRHTEILRDYQQEFRKTRNSIASLREHAELMAGAERSRPAGASMDAGGAGLDALYKERAGIAGATAGADTAIATGLSLKEDLDRQRAMFASMVERMETMSEGLPVVNRLIGQIRRKKKRDVLIIGAVVSTFLFMTFSWKVMG